MATIAARKIVEGGLAGSLSTAATGGDEFTNTGIEFVRIRNDHASTAYTVRITAQTTSIKHPTYGTVTKSNTDVTVAAGADAYIGPFVQGSWNDTNNKVQISYRTTSTYATGSAIGGGAHLLKLEILYLEN